MKAAERFKVRPSVLILGKDSRKPWGPWDIMLVRAYERFLSELCQQCGLPRYICHNDDSDIQFKPQRDNCASAAVAEREQERLTKADSKEFGTRLKGEPYLLPSAVAEGKELSDYRRPYLLDQMKRAAAAMEAEAGAATG